MKMNPIVHFEIPADDVERAKKFYEELFGWEIKKFDYDGEPYWSVHAAETDEKNMVKTPGAINGGMMKREKTEQGIVNYISVNSIDEKLDSVKAKGGKIVMKKTEIGKGMGWIAMFQDTEGNLMGLHELSDEMKKKE